MGLWREHFHWRILLDWVVLAWALPTLLAIAGLLLAIDRFWGANLCLIIVAVFVLAKIAYLAITSTDPFWQRALFTFVLFGLVGVGIVETVRGVNRWRDSKSKLAEQPHNVAEVPAAKIPASIRVKYSSRQVLQISNVPGDYNEILNLDNVATLRLSAPFSREVVTLLWPTSPTVTVMEPRGDEKYKVPGDDTHTVQVPQVGHGVAMQGLTIVGQAQRITFDLGHPVRLMRVGERIFRISLEALRDKASAEKNMFLEYEFAISEEEPTVENRAAAVTQEIRAPPQPGHDSMAEKLLTTLKTQPIGTIELRLRAVVDGRPNVVQLSGETKSFLFDPGARIAVFHMVTSAGKSVDLHLPLEKPAPDGRYFIVFVWDTSKGARLHVNDKFVGDGL